MGSTAGGGLVVSRAVDEYGFAHVVTHDLDRAETALRPVYGGSLLLTASPWPPEVFHHIEKLMDIGDHEEVAFITGGGERHPGWHRPERGAAGSVLNGGAR